MEEEVAVVCRRVAEREREVAEVSSGMQQDEGRDQARYILPFLFSFHLLRIWNL